MMDPPFESKPVQPTSSAPTQNTGVAPATNGRNHDDQGKEEETQTMVDKLVDFYTNAGLIRVDSSSLPTTLQGFKPITEEWFEPETFKVLECPICYQYCLPPISGCVNGHIICRVCKAAHQEACARLPPETPPPRYTCPTCRNPFFPVPMTVESRISQMLLDTFPGRLTDQVGHVE